MQDAPEDSKWKKKQKRHCQIMNTIKILQRKTGEDLPESVDLTTEYLTSARKKRRKNNPDHG